MDYPLSTVISVSLLFFYRFVHEHSWQKKKNFFIDLLERSRTGQGRQMQPFLCSDKSSSLIGWLMDDLTVTNSYKKLASESALYCNDIMLTLFFSQGTMTRVHVDENLFQKFWLHRRWWRMLETKYVGDNLRCRWTI